MSTLTRARRAVGAILLVAWPILAGLAAPARADAPPSAQDLLDRGRALMGNKATLDEACRSLEESLKLRDRGDTLLNLAECHRRQGRTASAWREFDRALTVGTQVGFTEAIQAATRLRNELALKLSQLTVRVPPEIAALEGFTVEVDGKPWPRAQWNTPTPFDPGRIEVTAVAKGYKRFVGSVDLGAERDLKTIAVALEPEAAALPPPPSPASPPPPPPPPPAQPVAIQPPRPVWPWIVGAAGLALSGIAIGFEVDSQNAHKALDAACQSGPARGCPPGYDYSPTRAREVRGFDIFVGLGAGGVAALGAAGIGLGLSSRARPTATALVVSPTSIAVRSSF